MVTLLALLGLFVVMALAFARFVVKSVLVVLALIVFAAPFLLMLVMVSSK